MGKEFKVYLGYRKYAKIDEKTWWLAPHCGDGTSDIHDDVCTFCAESYEHCAKTDTQSLEKEHTLVCGGSGFWCPKCGLFWAQDACGECYVNDFTNANPKLQMKSEAIGKDEEGEDIQKIFCLCGQYLFTYNGAESHK